MDLCVGSLAVALKIPFFVVERADTSCFEPARDAMEVESMVADAPGGSAFFCGVCDLIRLAVDARLHDVVLANRAVVDVDVYSDSESNGFVLTPGPEGDCIPLFYFKASSSGST